MPQRWKTVRIFITGTFRDKHAVQNHLVRFVFPELKEKCRKNIVHLIHVDLRWGVTQVGTKRLVMSLCSVLDKETKELMLAFCKNIIKWGMDRCQTVRWAAQNEMLIVKKSYGMVNPSY